VRRRGRPVPQEPSVVIKTPNLRTIGQSGSITLNKSLLIDQLGFSAGDAFEIYREDDRVVLKKISTSAV
jgi:bifunctional DNA-binding transcriptional regulator/antitoxin component of YhaV-PrlF toxin-antitoxin module